MRKVLFSLFMLAAVLLAATPAHAADVDGRWAGSIDTPMGAINVGFTFKADGAALSGSQTGMDGMDVPIKNGKVDADRISFVVTLDFGGMTFDLNYTGVVKPDNIVITADFMGMPFSFTVTKAK
jgi:hypothetical protein